MDPTLWQQGFSTVLGLAQGGAFGSDGRKVAGAVTGQIQPRSAVSMPVVAPPPAPVAGQQSVNPPPGGIVGHFAANWGKYALGLGAVVVLIVGVKLLRK
jgi:hypothetical protein